MWLCCLEIKPLSTYYWDYQSTQPNNITHNSALMISQKVLILLIRHVATVHVISHRGTHKYDGPIGPTHMSILIHLIFGFLSPLGIDPQIAQFSLTAQFECHRGSSRTHQWTRSEFAAFDNVSAHSARATYK